MEAHGATSNEHSEIEVEPSERGKAQRDTDLVKNFHGGECSIFLQFVDSKEKLLCNVNPSLPYIENALDRVWWAEYDASRNALR